MLRLTREVRLTLPFTGLELFEESPANGLAGNIPDGPGLYCIVQVTLEGEPPRDSQYIEDIKEMDRVVRGRPAGGLLRLLRSGDWTLERACKTAGEAIAPRWPGMLQGVRLRTNPCLWCDYVPRENPMLRLTQRFEFSAAHRLQNDELDEATNRQLYGKCNNPAGHGHNYEVDVTLAGEPDGSGRLMPLQQFTQLVNRLVIDRFDHKHLNVQTDEFKGNIPSVENIARVIYQLLESELAGKLHSVRVWETGKTSAEYRR